MNRLNTLALFTIAAVTASAQQTDSIAVHELGEVIIEAPKVIHRADMDVYHPSVSAVENAKNGVQLLSNLMIPSITVSDALGTISSAGQAVQVRINGREASVDQVKNLLSSTIKRVEWIENPGLRYNGANTVLNFIVTNPTVGGSFMLNTTQAFNVPWGQYYPSLKFNSGRSQIEVGGGYKLTQNLKVHRDFKETFTFPDGSKLTRDEKSLGGDLDNSIGNVWATYNYIKPDTTVIVIDARSYIKPANRTAYYGLMSTSDNVDDFLITEINGDKGARPTLSAYWEQHLPRKQMLVVDFKAQYYMGRTFSDYMENYPDTYG
ncbi:MAG: hypothetical protein K2M03_08635, partial [Muribaculaceae bacterium]|nr:hypothetical protein [Muribaculaceae bacterium]